MEITVSEYIDRIKQEIPKILNENNALNSEGEFKEKLLESTNDKKKLNEAGIKLLVNSRVKAQERHSYLNESWNYLNHIIYENYVYAAYFKMSGFDDLNYSVFKFKDNMWKNQEIIPYELKNPISDHLIYDEQEFNKNGYCMIIFNYDEGPANHENLKVYVKNNLLVFERGNLMHSLYDIRTQVLLVNEINPWYEAKKLNSKSKVDQDILNTWIKNNLHQTIENKLNKSASR